MAGVKYRGLDPRTRPLRWGLFLLVVAFVVVVAGDGAVQALMGAVGAERDRLPWYATRLFALLAYLALAASVIYGLLLSTGILDSVAHRAVSFTLHQDLAAVGLSLAMIHAALLALDPSVPYAPAEILVPFFGPYRPLWVGLGQVSLYLSAIVVGSFYVRRRIGQRAWRLLHYTTFLAFVGATAHGLMSGTDSGTPWAFGGYLAAASAVAFLFAYRVVISVAKRGSRPAPRLVAVPAPAASREIDTAA